MNIIKVDGNILDKYKLTVIQYMALWYIYHKIKDKEEKLVSNFGADFFNSQIYDCLEKDGYIKIINSKIKFRDDIRVLFEGNRDSFTRWLGIFPIKTPSKRYLSPVDPDTIMGQKLRKKWNKLFKNNNAAAEKAIRVLEAEMEWRRKTGKFEFMHNAETWLNQGDFEKMAYLLDDKIKEQSKIREDFE